MQIFNYSTAEVRIVLGNDDEPLFIATDVCRVLGIVNTSYALSRLPEKAKGIVTNNTLGGKQKMLYVTEAGLYRLVATSRKKEAMNFMDWVFEEVLPSIRKYGMYAVEELERQREAQRLIDQWNNMYYDVWLPKFLGLPEAKE